MEILEISGVLNDKYYWKKFRVEGLNHLKIYEYFYNLLITKLRKKIQGGIQRGILHNMLWEQSCQHTFMYQSQSLGYSMVFYSFYLLLKPGWYFSISHSHSPSCSFSTRNLNHGCFVYCMSKKSWQFIYSE